MFFPERSAAESRGAYEGGPSTRSGQNNLTAPTRLGRELLAALCYFDVFDYPLTAEELRRFRYAVAGTAAPAPTLADVHAALVGLPVGERDGFWFLAGREAAVAERQRRYRLAEPKFRRARRFARFLGLLPSVRLVAVCNSLALSHAHEGSDIDVFVAVRPGTIFATRLLAAGALQLLGLRPDEKTQADRICLSFLVTEDHLGLAPLAIRPDDPYLLYWIASLLPLHDAGGVYDDFMAANGWVGEHLPGVRPVVAGHRRQVAPPRAGFLLGLLRRLDPAARKIQMRLFPEAIRSAANRSSDVIVSDCVLKFHVHDERRRYHQEFLARLRHCGLA